MERCAVASIARVDRCTCTVGNVRELCQPSKLTDRQTDRHLCARTHAGTRTFERQQTHDSGVSAEGRLVQGCAAVSIASIHVGTSIEEQANEVHVSIKGNLMEGVSSLKRKSMGEQGEYAHVWVLCGWEGNQAQARH